MAGLMDLLAPQRHPLTGASLADLMMAASSVGSGTGTVVGDSAARHERSRPRSPVWMPPARPAPYHVLAHNGVILRPPQRY